MRVVGIVPRTIVTTSPAFVAEYCQQHKRFSSGHRSGSNSNGKGCCGDANQEAEDEYIQNEQGGGNGRIEAVVPAVVVEVAVAAAMVDAVAVPIIAIRVDVAEVVEVA